VPPIKVRVLGPGLSFAVRIPGVIPDALRDAGHRRQLDQQSTA
jgi:hypothetical protein